LGSTWGHGHGFSNKGRRDKKAHKKARDNPDGKHTERNNPTGKKAGGEDPCVVIALIGIGIGSAVGGWL
jgi:hypothetical protein